jgi:general secretion pathway protein B
MSILLDALRKSEEQRRLGSTPSIHDGGQAPRPGGESAQQWVPLSLIALSAIVLFWIVWRQYEPPVAGTGVDGTAVAEQAAAAEGRDAAPAPAPRRPQTAGRTAVESYADDVRAPQVHAGQPADQKPVNAQSERVSRSFQDFKRENEPAGDAEAEDAAAVALTAPDAALERPSDDGPGADPSPSRSRSSPPQETAGGPITFWELPQGVRDSMPELRITVLVYAEQPENRFLLMGGQRLVEKDEYEGGVVLDEIRRDGAVFLYRNYRFLVKG